MIAQPDLFVVTEDIRLAQVRIWHWRYVYGALVAFA